MMKHIEPHDLVKFGIIPELVGRIPIITALEELEEAIREMSITAHLTAEQVIIPNNSVDGTVTLNLNGTQINMDLLNEMVGDVSVALQRKKRSKES